ncbi:MAG: response regulator transcription factor [Atopobiaceae bacterium]|nr:response regulator transcription factor [Atopobiaceae bacterium]
MAQLIYLADDDPSLLDVFGAFLESAGYEVGLFPTGDELMEAFAQHEADLVVLDVMMPGTDGLTVCRNLRAISDVPIVILTARDSEMDYLQGLAIGGDDYIAKPFSPAMLVMRVKALLRRVDMGKARSQSEVLAYGDVTLSEEAHEVRVGKRRLELTMNEFALLRCLLAAGGQPVSRDVLLSDVWGITVEVETRVVDECVRRVRAKLRGMASCVGIKAVWGYGYRLVGGESEDAETA